MSLTPQEFDAQMPDGTQLLSVELEMDSSLHYAQLVLLVACLELLWQGRSDYFLGANLTVYGKHPFGYGGNGRILSIVSTSILLVFFPRLCCPLSCVATEFPACCLALV